MLGYVQKEWQPSWNFNKVLIGRDDRLFPAEFQRRVDEDRLGLDADEIPGGHLVALSNPSGLAALLVAYAAKL